MTGPSPTRISSGSHRFRRFEPSAEHSEAVRRLVGHTIAEIECELIVETLIDQGGSRTNASRILGISLRTLRNKIREYRKRGRTLPEPGATEGTFRAEPSPELMSVR
jgi:DNA-binding NtrC family response regulator